MGKLTDYGIVMMSYLATEADSKHSAQSLSSAVQMPLPTVRKVLKALSHGGLLNSERGAQGGYSLAREAKAISVAEIITALEGPIALTECVSSDNQCEQESHCSIQTNWNRINSAVYTALDEVKLSDMLLPGPTQTSPIVFYPIENIKVTQDSGELNG
jgi:FeS assembly SUF system regulator